MRGRLVTLIYSVAAIASQPSDVPAELANRKPELIDPIEWLHPDRINPCTWAGCPTGKVSFTLLISPEGRVTNCAVIRTSGSRRLDKVTCKTLLRYARFDPATDASGKPIKGRYASSVTWKVPNISEDAQAPPQK